MASRFFLLAAISTVFLLGACKKIPDEKDAYIGTWTSEQTSAHLEILHTGRVHYTRPAAGNRTEEGLSAEIKRFSGDSIVLSGDTVLDVSKPPHQVGDVWRMTVNGDELTKQ